MLFVAAGTCIPNGSDSRRTQLRWVQLSWCTYQISWRLIQALENLWEGGYTDAQTERLSHKLTFTFSNRESRLKIIYPVGLCNSAVCSRYLLLLWDGCVQIACGVAPMCTIGCFLSSCKCFVISGSAEGLLTIKAVRGYNKSIASILSLTFCPYSK
jgi:hypothetical protein